jgi:hypothetical protein
VKLFPRLMTGRFRQKGRPKHMRSVPGEPARTTESGSGWPLKEPPPGRDQRDSAGRHWVMDEDDRWWIEADGLWYPSFPDTSLD